MTTVKACAFREDGSAHGEIVTISHDHGGYESAHYLCRLTLLSTPAVQHCEVWNAETGSGVIFYHRNADGGITPEEASDRDGNFSPVLTDETIRFRGARHLVCNGGPLVGWLTACDIRIRGEWPERMPTLNIDCAECLASVDKAENPPEG